MTDAERQEFKTMVSVDREQKTITISQNTGITISVALGLMIAGVLVTSVTFMNGLINRTTNLEIATSQHQTDIKTLQYDNAAAKITAAKLETRLTSIDTTLLEIKERLR